MSSTSPTRFTMATTEYLPLSWDAVNLLEAGQSVTNVTVTLTRVDPLPELAVPAALGGSPSVSGTLVTQYVDGSELAEGASYEVAVTFVAAPSATIWTMSSIIEVPAVPPISTGTSLRQLRQRVGRLLGDMLLLKATANGTDTSFIDTDNLIMPDNGYRGHDVLMVSSASQNRGKIRRVLSSTQGTGRINFISPLPVATAEGDTAELWNKHGSGWRPQEVNDHIREAHQRAMAHAPVEAIVPLGTWSRGTPSIDVPSRVVAVYGMQWLGADQEWSDVIPAARPNGPGYWPSKADRKLYVSGYWREAMDQREVRLLGYCLEPELLGDDDETAINAEWLVVEACRNLLSVAMDRLPDQRAIQQRIGPMMQEAIAKRTMAAGRRQPNTVWMR